MLERSGADNAGPTLHICILSLRYPVREPLRSEVLGLFLAPTTAEQRGKPCQADTRWHLFSIDFSGGNIGLIVGNHGTILRTDDGGHTWSEAPSGTDSALTNVRFFGSTIAWVATRDGSVLRSSDAGRTWSQIATHQTNTLLGILPLDSMRAIAVGSSGTMVSTSDAEHWATVSVPVHSALDSIAVSTSGTLAAVGHAGGILVFNRKQSRWELRTRADQGFLQDVYSSDKGTWIAGHQGELVTAKAGGRRYETQLSKPPVEWMSIAFEPSAQHGFLLGFHGELFRTDNGGRSWKESGRIADASPRCTEVVLADESHAWIVGVGLWRTANAGLSWEKLKAAQDWYTAGSFTITREKGYRGVVADTSGRLLVTKDGGNSWTPSKVDGAGSAINFIGKVTFVDPDHAWAVANDGIILQSEDGGDTWVATNTGQHEELSDIKFAKDGMRGWIVGTNGILGITSDAGKTWIFKRFRSHNLRAIAFSDPNNGTAVGWGGEVIQTSDGGLHWTDYEPSWWPSPWYYASWFLVALIAMPGCSEAPARPGQRPNHRQ